VVPSQRSHQEQPEGIDAPRKRSRRVKMSVVDSCSVAAPPHSGPLSTTDFDLAEWEIMYSRFVDEGLVDPSDRAH
jgi:hypothetical protein